MNHEEWRWVAASQRGTSHEAAGERRQDAFRVLAAGDALIAVVCDGAGSAPFGGAGAALVARMISSLARNHMARHCALPSDADLIAWVCLVRIALSHAAERRGCLVGAFATTLVCAISVGDMTLTLHIGDGTIVVRPSDETDYAVLSWPEQGEFVCETYFITDAQIQVAISRHDMAVDQLALMSDGLERLALRFVERSAHPGFFTTMFAPLAAAVDANGRNAALSAQLRAFLASPSVNARTDDDKTLVLAVRG